MVIIAMSVRKSRVEEEMEKHQFLVDKAGKHSNTIMRIQSLAHDSGVWTLAKAKDLLDGETALALSKLLKFEKEKPPPLTKWEDASWHFKWSINKHHGTLCSTWLAVAELDENTEVWFQKLGKQRWACVPEDMESLLNTEYKGDGTSTQ